MDLDYFNLTKYCIEKSTSERPDKTALKVFGHGAELTEIWSFRQVKEAVLGVSHYFASLEIPPFSRIMVRIGNSSDFPMVFFGAIAAGLVPIPTSTMLTKRECDYILADSQASVLVHDGKTELPSKTDKILVLGPDVISVMKSQPIGQYVLTDKNDPAFLIYTSGTSGKPKGVLHAHRFLLGRAPMYEHWYGINSKDVMLHSGAFNWTYTLGTGLMDPWVNGATSSVFNGIPTPEIWFHTINLSFASLFASVPSFFRKLLRNHSINRYSFPYLRHCLSAGEPLPLQLREEWVDKTGIPIFEAFGMSEISTYISSGPTVPVRPGSPGKFQKGRKCAILPLDEGTKPLPAGETGVLAVNKDETGLMMQYLGGDSETQSAYRGKWFLTGDTGYLDEDGYFWFAGRSDDVMNTFGYRVAPREVEAVLVEHPDLAEVAVTQINVKKGVDVIAAFAVPKKRVTTTVESLESWCTQRLASYKRPKHYQIVKKLPRTESGKILRKKLFELVELDEKS